MRHVASIPLAFALAAAPAAGQLEAAIDVGFDHDFVWRGLTRVSRPTIQPAVVLGWKSPSILFNAGGWALLEPWRPRAGDLTLAGSDARLGELEVWAEADYRLRVPSVTFDVRAGVTRYVYHGDASTGGLGSDHNTIELYAGVRFTGLRQLYTVLGLPPDLPIGVEAAAAFDLGDIGGTHLEAGLESDLPVLFIGEPLGSVTMRLTGAWSWNQEVTATEPGYYEGEGFTHVTLAAGVTPFLPIGPIPAALHLGGSVQYGVDEATLRRGADPDDRSRWTSWGDIIVSVFYPLRRSK